MHELRHGTPRTAVSAQNFPGLHHRANHRVVGDVCEKGVEGSSSRPQTGGALTTSKKIKIMAFPETQHSFLQLRLHLGEGIHDDSKTATNNSNAPLDDEGQGESSKRGRTPSE